MRRIFYIIWFVLLVLIFLALGVKCWRNQKLNEYVNITVQAIDSLFVNQNGIGLVTLGYGDCQICDELLDRDFYKDLNEPKCYLDITRSLNNRFLSQALYAKGFPTTYVINDQYEILGAIRGVNDFQNQLDSILCFQQPVCDIVIHNIVKDSTLIMLTDSFQALLCYWKRDFTGMKVKTIESLEKGSYFFNNYLMYLVYKEENKTDSVALYRAKALRHGAHVNSFIYSDLIDELKNESQ